MKDIREDCWKCSEYDGMLHEMIGHPPQCICITLVKCKLSPKDPLLAHFGGCVHCPKFKGKEIDNN